MWARDLFGLIVRVTGVGFVIFSVFDLFYAAAALIGLPLQSYGGRIDLAAAALWLAMGVIFISRAEWITRIAYGRNEAV